VSRTIAKVGVLVALVLSTGPARGELVSYSFTGTDSITGTPVIGSFSYQTNTPSHLASPDRAIFPDVGGSLTITALGHTYSTNAVGGVFQPDSLFLLHSDSSGPFFAIALTSPDGATVFPQVSFLPPSLNLGSLGGSQFRIAEVNSQTEIAGGPITLSAPAVIAEAAPEPGALTLAAAALAAAAVRLSCSKGSRGSPRRPAP
jgi:hypothetical protein